MLSECIYAQSVVNIDETAFSNLSNKVFFWKDQSAQHNIGFVQNLPDSTYRRSRSAIFNGGTSGDVWWMKIKFTNSLMNSPYLFLDYTNIDSIDVYYLDNFSQFKHIRSGIFGSNSSVKKFGTGFIFDLQNVSGIVKTVYVRMRAKNTLLVPLKLLSENTLNNAMLKKYSIQLIYSGLALMMLIVHLFIYSATRSRLFALYIGRFFFLFFLGMVLYLQGYGILLGPEIGRFILRYAHVFVSIGYICSILFNNHFLKLKNRFPNAYLISNLLIALWLLLMITSIFSNLSITNKVTQTLTFFTSFLILFSSTQVILYKGYGKSFPMIKFFVIGWIPVAIVSVYLILCFQNIIPFQDYSFNLLSLACIIEVMIISSGLFGQRIRLINRYNAHFRKQRIVLQQQLDEYKNQLRDKKNETPPINHQELKKLAYSNDPSFLTFFINTEEEFVTELLNIQPNLSNAEIELAAYMRLNFETKEIARVCKISVRAVESRKYRLRKKLLLKSSVNLQLWLLGLPAVLKYRQLVQLLF